MDSPFYEVIAAQNMTAEHQRTDADQHIAKGQAEIFLHTHNSIPPTQKTQRQLEHARIFF